MASEAASLAFIRSTEAVEGKQNPPLNREETKVKQRNERP